MKFTAWQIMKLRRWLLHYQALHSFNGEVLPFKTVHGNLVMCPATSQSFGINGKEPELKEEALRRFVRGLTPLDPFKLNDIKQFLLAENVIVEADLDESKALRTEAMTVWNYLGQQASKDAQRQITKLAEHYKAARLNVSADVYGGTVEDIDLYVAKEPGNEVLFVEEHYRLRRFATIIRGDVDFPKDKQVRANFIARGYGFTMSDKCLICLFFRMPNTGAVVSLTQVARPPLADDSGAGAGAGGGDKRSGDLFFVRTGSRPFSEHRADSETETLNRLNVFRFTPAE